MSKEKQYLGMVWHDGRLIYNCAPLEHQTIHLAPAQIIPLLKSLESCLEVDPLSKLSTDLTSWLEGYQDGFSASHLLKTEVCNRCSSQSSEEKPLSQTGQTSSQSSGLSTQNLSSSSPRSVPKDARTDSTSEAGSETVAQPAFELSVEELLKIIDGYIPEALKIRAINELKRRTGEGKASS